MVVLVGNLPKQAAEKDLCQLLGLTSATAVRIVKHPARDGTVQRFALVPVEGEKRARRIIGRVHGMQWQGMTLVAHEYRRRTGAHERRRLDWRSTRREVPERRIDERRSFSRDARSRVA